MKRGARASRTRRDRRTQLRFIRQFFESFSQLSKGSVMRALHFSFLNSIEIRKRTKIVFFALFAMKGH